MGRAASLAKSFCMGRIVIALTWLCPLAGILNRTGSVDSPAALAEADSCESFLLAKRAQNDGVSVHEEASLFTIRQSDRLLTTEGQFHEASSFTRCRARLRTGAKEIAGSQITSVFRVMSHHLGQRPNGMTIAAMAESECLTGTAECFQPCLDLDVICARGSAVSGDEVREAGSIFGETGDCCTERR